MCFGCFADMFWICVLHRLEDYASRLMFSLFVLAYVGLRSLLVRMYFVFHFVVSKIVRLVKMFDVWHSIGLMHGSHGQLGLYVYFASALVSPIFHTLIVCDFCKTAFGILGLLAITAPNY